MIKELLLFPIKGMYNFLIKSRTDFHIHDEMVLIVKLEIIFLFSALFLNPIYSLILMIGNLINIPLILYIGGKSPHQIIKEKIKDFTLNVKKKISKNGEVKFQIDDKEDKEEIITSGTKFFDEDANVLNKISSLGRLKLLEIIVKFLIKKDKFMTDSLAKILKEEEIDFIEDSKQIESEVEEEYEDNIYSNENLEKIFSDENHEEVEEKLDYPEDILEKSESTEKEKTEKKEINPKDYFSNGKSEDKKEVIDLEDLMKNFGSKEDKYYEVDKEDISLDEDMDDLF